MIEKVKWLGHATFKIEAAKVIYIDPWKIKKPDKADIVLVSHPHFDHLSEEDIEKLQKESTVVVAPADCKEKITGDFRPIAPGEKVSVDGVEIEAVPSYNTNKDFHPKGNEWLGFIVTIDGERLYYAGDTDVIPEMKELKNIDVALFPVGGTYTLTAGEAAGAANSFMPKIAVPYHYGDIVGTAKDAEEFKEKCNCEVVILKQS